MIATQIDRQKAVKALIGAMTEGDGSHQWMSLFEIRRRLPFGGISMAQGPLAQWLNQLAANGKVARKMEGHLSLYQLIDDNAPSGESLPAPIEPPELQAQRDGSDQPPRELPKWYLLKRQDYENEIAALQRKVNEYEVAIMEHKTESRRALSIYGSENALDQLTAQVALSPQYKDLTPAEHRYVAMTGLMSGLNPVFHLHAWINEKTKNGKTERTLTVTPDYKALIAATPDPIMTDERRLTADEMRERGIPDDDIERGAIAFEVSGTNLKHAIMARQAGQEYKPKRGFGWWAAQKWNKWDKKWEANDVPTGRDGAWVARKRAIRDLFNQMADLRIKFGQVPGADIQGDEWVFAGDVIDGEFIESKPPAEWLNEAGINAAERYLREKSVTDDELNATLSIGDWRKTPLTADELKVAVDQIVVKRQMEAAANGEVINGEIVEEVPETPDVEPIEAAKMCANCGVEPATETPAHPGGEYCGNCSSKLADAKAAKKEK